MMKKIFTLIAIAVAMRAVRKNIYSSQDQKKKEYLIYGNKVAKSMSFHRINNSDKILKSLTNIDRRLYSVEEKVDWLRNGGRHIGDARGPSGTPGNPGLQKQF